MYVCMHIYIYTHIYACVCVCPEQGLRFPGANVCVFLISGFP